MIPQRIVLQGFLCHRQRQELSFGDSPLWMLAGLNGSGKSAVFDAVTYALFGGHRGGVQHAEQLINKDADGLVVEFDFRLADDIYRIKRTLRKAGRSTRQLLRLSGNGDGTEIWDAVENTGGARGFEDWIKDHIGLNYETFTSSVLLMQGRADKLLNADHNERRKVLAGIVDLERYEKLHKRADELRKKHKDRAEELQNKLSVSPEVADSELAAVVERISAAERQLGQARAAVERWQRLEVQAERWTELQARLAQSRHQWERARGLLDRADTIERDWERLRELREVLPSLKVIADQKQRLDESLRTVRVLEGERDSFTKRLQELTYAEDQTRQKREQLQQVISSEQQREHELAARLQVLAGTLKQVELFEQQQQTVARVEGELEKLAFDPARFTRERQECERLGERNRVLPVLARFSRKREELRQSTEQVRQAAEQEAPLIEEGRRLAAKVAEMELALKRASEERHKATEGAAQARARLDDARKEVAALDTVAGEKRCRHCGQELTPEHLEREKVRREKLRSLAETAFHTADKVHKQAAAEETRCETTQRESQRELIEARDRFKDFKARAAAAEQRARQAANECREAFEELPPSEQQRVMPAECDDWLTTAYPTASALEEMRREVQGLPATRQRLQEAEAAQQRWTRLQAERDAAAASLQAQQSALPADPAGVRREHDQRQKDDADLKKTLQARRTQWKEEEQTLERLGRERDGVRQHLAEREQKLEAERVRQEGCRDALARARESLPTAWQPEADGLTSSGLLRWQSERDVLEQQGAETQAKDLEQARQSLEPLRREISSREADLEAVPAEARAEPAVMRQQVLTAKREQTRCEEVLGAARGELQALRQRRERRQQLHEELLTQDRLFNRYKLLTELLGPRRLQLHLVRQAEAGIVEYANEVLDRLAAGQLYLKLRGGDGEDSAEKALELEAYVRSAGDSPVGVPFLSGSQRFRVAVSLALGIGRYASRSHRPIESVIIDEGFGCLDRQGRQVMIQELQNLREHLRCILLVSHQEEFADAFANGYHFEMTESGTEVTRFQR